MNDVDANRVIDKLLQQIAQLNRTNAMLSVRVEDLTAEVQRLQQDEGEE